VTDQSKGFLSRRGFLGAAGIAAAVEGAEAWREIGEQIQRPASPGYGTASPQ